MRWASADRHEVAAQLAWVTKVGATRFIYCVRVDMDMSTPCPVLLHGKRVR